MGPLEEGEAGRQNVMLLCGVVAGELGWEPESGIRVLTLPLLSSLFLPVVQENEEA